jgi:hypothetical protein
MELEPGSKVGSEFVISFPKILDRNGIPNEDGPEQDTQEMDNDRLTDFAQECTAFFGARFR